MALSGNGFFATLPANSVSTFVCSLNGSTTDTGNAKLEEYNKRTGIKYTTDFTNEFVDGTLSSTDQVIIAVENKIKEPESDGESKVYPFNLNNLIITNMTPVMWTNYNTLKYNGKTSLSKVYRYEKYNT